MFTLDAGIVAFDIAKNADIIDEKRALMWLARSEEQFPPQTPEDFKMRANVVRIIYAIWRNIWIGRQNDSST